MGPYLAILRPSWGQSDAINIKSNHEQKSNNMLFDFWGQLEDLKGNLKAILDHLVAIGGLSWAIMGPS